MLFGLNALDNINANISNDFLRYCVKVENGTRERFGKIPLLK